VRVGRCRKCVTRGVFVPRRVRPTSGRRRGLHAGRAGAGVLRAVQTLRRPSLFGGQTGGGPAWGAARPHLFAVAGLASARAVRLARCFVVVSLGVTLSPAPFGSWFVCRRRSGRGSFAGAVRVVVRASAPALRCRSWLAPRPRRRSDRGSCVAPPTALRSWFVRGAPDAAPVVVWCAGAGRRRLMACRRCCGLPRGRERASAGSSVPGAVRRGYALRVCGAAYVGGGASRARPRPCREAIGRRVAFGLARGGGAAACAAGELRGAVWRARAAAVRKGRAVDLSRHTAQRAGC
jgi:hypothetical protein